jgi:hypothetical protein
MKVRVEVELTASPTEMDGEEMAASARALTNHQKSVMVSVPEDKPNTIVAEFTVNKARQMDVVDGIAREFRCFVSNYSHSAISFSKSRSKQVQEMAPQYTHKQGQYLAFIYYYTKLNGRSPAEADIQKYFRTTPPTVHNMIVKLELKGLIKKEPYVSRSISLLLSRDELPDLE